MSDDSVTDQPPTTAEPPDNPPWALAETYCRAVLLANGAAE